MTVTKISFSENRIRWIDQLRLIACIAVVFVHVSGQSYTRYGSGVWEEWWLANVLTGSCRAAVPVFLMISGAMLRQVDCDALLFYRKKAIRFLPVILFWTMLYTLFDVAVMGQSLTKVILGFVSHGNVYVHLWYLNMFTFMLAFAPFLAKLKFAVPLNSTDWRLLASLCFALFSLDWALTFASRAAGILYSGWVGAFSVFLPYFLLGAVLSTSQPVIKRRLCGIILACALFVSWIFNWWSCSLLGVIDDVFPLSNTSPHVFVIAVTLFLFLRSSELSETSAPRWLTVMAKASLGIYLIHPFYIWLFVRIARESRIDLLSGWWMLFTAFSAFFASLVFVLLLRRLPLGQKVC